MLTFYLTVCLLLTYFSSAHCGTCVKYGYCPVRINGTTTKLDRECVADNIKPSKLTSRMAVLDLKKHCPDIYSNYKSEGVCCDAKQLAKLDRKLFYMDFAFPNCPLCLRNIKQFFCQTMCSPNQDKFVEINKKRQTKKGVVVEELTFYLKKQFVENLLESCVNVQLKYANKPFYEHACNSSTIEECSVDKFLKNMKSKLPIVVNIELTDKQFVKKDSHLYEPLDALIVPCDSITPENYTCTPTSCYMPTTITAQPDEPMILIGEANTIPSKAVSLFNNKSFLLFASIILLFYYQ